MFIKIITVIACAALAVALKLSGMVGGDAPAALVIMFAFLFDARLALACALLSGFFLDLFSPIFGVHLALYSILSLTISTLAQQFITNRSVGAFLVLTAAASALFLIVHAFVLSFFSGSPLYIPKNVSGSIFLIMNFFAALFMTTLLAACSYAAAVRFAPQRRAFLIIGRS